MEDSSPARRGSSEGYPLSPVRIDSRTIGCVSEITDVLEAIESLSARGEKMALATIVAVRGSTYRRPGARLLVPEDGAPVGNISGGCLEGDVADMARIVMEEGRARLAGWDLTADDDDVWGLGLGCNGAIEVFIEPADRAAEVAGALRMALEEERPISVVTVLESASTQCRRARGSSSSPMGRAKVRSVTQRSTQPRWRRRANCSPRRRRRSAPSPATSARSSRSWSRRSGLLICGAGHDAIPLVKAASILGWRPIVIDDRPGFLTRERYPDAAGFIQVERPEDAAEWPRSTSERSSPS